MVAVAKIDNVFHDTEIEAIIRASEDNSKLGVLTSDEIQALISEQSDILGYDFKGALESLSFLLKRHDERLEAVEMMKKIADSDSAVSPEEDQLIIEVMEILNILS